MAPHWQTTIKKVGRLCAIFVAASLFYMVFVHSGPPPPPKIGSNAYLIAKAKTDWAELCAIEDCSQFPVGYATYKFGPEVYYFPQYHTMTEKPPSVRNGGVRSARYLELDDENIVLRSYGDSKSLIISNCCHYLLSFYGLAEDFPLFRESRQGNRMPSTRMIIASYDATYRDNELKRHFDIDLNSNQPPPISAVLSGDQMSYNEDFWLLDVRKKNEADVLNFEILSKRPLLNGRHVYALCGSGCNISTLTFAKDANNQRPHVNLLWLTMTQESMFACAPYDIKNGCKPAPGAFDKVPLMLSVIEDMFEAAKIHPKDRM